MKTDVLLRSAEQFHHLDWNRGERFEAQMTFRFKNPEGRLPQAAALFSFRTKMTNKGLDMKNGIFKIGTQEVESRLVNVRGQMVLLDRDMAELYGVQTREINQAVRNNQEKFPERFLIQLNTEEKKELVKNFDRFNTMKHSTVLPIAFKEQGLYMLATILKGQLAVETTIAIIDTFVQMREMARTMERLQNVADGGSEQQTLLRKTGELLADVIGRNLSTESVETEIELNFAVVKIKHKMIKTK